MIGINSWPYNLVCLKRVNVPETQNLLRVAKLSLFMHCVYKTKT